VQNFGQRKESKEGKATKTGQKETVPFTLLTRQKNEKVTACQVPSREKRSRCRYIGRKGKEKGERKKMKTIVPGKGGQSRSEKK